MRLLSCDIQNFLSIEAAHVDFDNTGLLLIEGWNYDVDRANGAGKTAILNAISFALYDKLPRKVTATELLRRGAKSGSVTVEVDTGTETLVARRSRPKGVQFYRRVDGELEALSLTQEEWESKLRLTYNQFIVSMYCSQANSVATPRFLLLNDSDKKQFLLQLLNLNEFVLCKQKVDTIVQQCNIKFSSLQQKAAELQVKIEAYSESVVDENKIILCINDKQEYLAQYMKALQENQLIIKPDLAKYQKIEDEILAKKADFAHERTIRGLLMIEWKKLNAATSSCPTCGSELDISHIENEKTRAKNDIDRIDAKLLSENQINDLYAKLKERKRKESAEYDAASLRGVEFKASINRVETEIEGLKKNLNDNAVLLDKISKLKQVRDGIINNMADLSKEIEVHKTVAAIYSPTGAQAYVLDSAVALFNEQIAKHISSLWSNLTYELQSYKENVKGQVTAKFSESIVMDGKPISLGSLSGGELKALSICTDMALLGLLEQQFGLHMSPVIFDEAFDGLDTSGKEFALELIRGLAQDRQVIVIDHASEMRASFDKIIRVEKRSGVSTVSVTT